MAQDKSYAFRKKAESTPTPSRSEEPYQFKRNEAGPNTTVAIAVLLVIIVIFGGALLAVLSQKDSSGPSIVTNNTNTSMVDTSTNTTLPPDECTGSCLYAQAVEDGDYTVCLLIENSTIMEECLEYFANSSLDACKLLTDSSKLESCITDFAVAEGNTSLCDLLSADDFIDCMVRVDDCYIDPEPNLCRALKYNDPTECNDDYCLLNYSITKSEGDTCNNISDTTLSTACTSIIYSESSCEDLQAEESKEYCHQLYSMFTGDYSYCEEITDLESTYALDCYSDFAVAEADYTICNTLKLDQRWDCYSYYSFETDDLDGCNNIDPLATTSLFTCVFEYAKEYGNPAACNIIADTTSRIVCFQGPIIYSQENLNWQYCEDVSNTDWSHKCFNEAAKLENDISICDEIDVDYAREACRIAYEVNQTG